VAWIRAWRRRGRAVQDPRCRTGDAGRRRAEGTRRVRTEARRVRATGGGRVFFGSATIGWQRGGGAEGPWG
jgi:hypothetical protein